MRIGALLTLFLLCSFTHPKGVEYQHVIQNFASIHVLEVDPNQCRLIPARALDKCVGRENVLSMATRKKALGGVNGGFFSTGGYHNGAPCGILKIGGTWYGLPVKPRGAIGWRARGREVLFDRLLTRQEGINFRIDPQGETTSEQWEKMDHVVGGTPLLIQNGKKIVDYSPEQTVLTFLNLPHARTAVGVLPNGNWVLVVVDLPGMTMDALADFMGALGCVQALNLDGGGSSTCVYQGELINSPAGDEDEPGFLRAVSDAILIFPK